METSILAIDQNNLVEEWKKQASAFHVCAIEQANAKRFYDDAKASFEKCKADLTIAAYATPEKFNLDKITDARVANAVIAHKYFQNAQTFVIAARQSLDYCAARTVALEHKKSALKNLVILQELETKQLELVTKQLELETKQLELETKQLELETKPQSLFSRIFARTS